jgi:hypothetical protein
MIFVVTGQGENGPVSFTCDTAAGSLDRARWYADRGVKDLLIDAGGHEYAPADFDRLFVQPEAADAPPSKLGLDRDVE